MQKLVKDLKRGDIIRVKIGDDDRGVRAVITSKGQAHGSIPEDKCFDILFVAIEVPTDHAPQHGALSFVKGDLEIVVYELIGIDDDPLIPNDFAIAIAEEAHRHAFMAGATKAHRVDTEMATEADWAKWTSEAWSAYEPSERVKAMTS